MWLTAPNRLGVAGWQAGEAVWMIDAKGDSDGIRLRMGDGGMQVASSDQRPLPTLEEQFVRGEELHLDYPQGADGEFGFHLVVRPIEQVSFQLDAQRILFELVVSIQTTLLDSHPTLDLVGIGEGVRGRPLDVGDPQSVHAFETGGGDAVILLGPHDSPFTSVLVADNDLMRLRLFGEFLEKGVIRRARPWVLMSRGMQGTSDAEVDAIWTALAESPVPLT